ncbi:DUF7344 domain-containing protein [Haloarcula litorea]|uniref:DUF7344 domain-containing protein n=1 Tax=Haloarcula litorea TaxID=3032579 RepID=UPI0023E89F42|nr:hypothetical protein [Halomicroarcula sp. GDY20]
MSAQDQSVTGTSIADSAQSESGAGPPSEAAGSRGTEAEAERPSLSLDLVFEILKNSRRREVLKYLRDKPRGERVALGELAEHVAAIENDTTTEALTSSQRKRVYVGLYQCHLPKMDDMGVVDFNQDRGRVEIAPAADEVMAYLDTPEEGDTVRWYRYYGAVTLIGVAVLSFAAVTGLSGTLLLGMLSLVVATVGFCAGCHWLVDARDQD